MTVAFVIAAAFLVLALLLFFGPQVIAYGHFGLRDALSRPEARLIGGGLLAVMTMLLFAPVAASVLISEGETRQVVAQTLAGLLGA